MKESIAPVEIVLIEDNVHDSDLTKRVFTKKSTSESLPFRGWRRSS